jgi:hypothetical protein
VNDWFKPVSRYWTVFLGLSSSSLGVSDIFSEGGNYKDS